MKIHLVGRIAQRIALAAGIVLVVLWVPSAARAATIDVALNDFFFEPSSVSGAPGDRISFRNEGSVAHRIVAADGGFNSGTLAPHDQFSIALGEEPIEFACAVHPSMTGTIAVTVGAGGPVTTSPAIKAHPAIAAASTTRPELALTGSGTASRAILATLALATGAIALLARQRRLPLMAATVSGDSLLPAREAERRERVRCPPAEI